jgi:FtsP/CotA-like multicopper oxidase with cupredoxin domain
MRRISKKRKGVGAALALSVAVTSAAMLGATGPAAAQSPGPRVGVVCTSNANSTFTLTTHTGYINLPDGSTAYMWGYSNGGDGFQHPGPVLCVNEGDTVTIVLHNTLPQDVSIAFPGQNNVLANGAAAQPQFDGGGNLTSLTNVAAANGGSVTYSFVADHPGTFLYESGTNPEIQVRMGLFGALIVRPTMGANFAYNRADSQFDPTEEFLALLSEIDPYLNQAVEAGKTFNITKYHPRYWLINGRGFPDSIADNFASWLPNQPYGSLAEILPYDADTHPNPALDRYLSVGTEDYPFHPHGNNGVVIGRDGHPLEGPLGEDLSFEKFSVPVGPGQTWDLLFKWQDDNDYSLNNPVPVTEPNLQNLVIGMFYGGSPYLGETGPLPPGSSTLNECGEFYIISHNHALYQITSWGVNMTGPITYTRVDPPDGSCPG